MCVVDEIFGKEGIECAKNEVYQNEGIPSRLRSLLLVERQTFPFSALIIPSALCRNVLQDFDGALRDVKLAVSLDPKSAAARKCRYKVYRNMAAEAAADENEDGSENDELDENGASSDDERGNRPNLKKLLMKGAFDALSGLTDFLIG